MVLAWDPSKESRGLVALKQHDQVDYCEPQAVTYASNSSQGHSTGLLLLSATPQGTGNV